MNEPIPHLNKSGPKDRMTKKNSKEIYSNRPCFPLTQFIKLNKQ